MSDLVKNLRATARVVMSDTCIQAQAADRIEQLERELAEVKMEASSYHDAYEAQKIGRGRDVDLLSAQLTIERAMAEQFCICLIGLGEGNRTDVAAYRKARGL